MPPHFPLPKMVQNLVFLHPSLIQIPEGPAEPSQFLPVQQPALLKCRNLSTLSPFFFPSASPPLSKFLIMAKKTSPVEAGRKGVCEENKCYTPSKGGECPSKSAAKFRVKHTRTRAITHPTTGCQKKKKKSGGENQQKLFGRGWNLIPKC